MAKFEVHQKIMLVGIKPTKNPEYTIYTLLDKNFDKLNVLSDKKFEGLEEGKMVEAKLEISIKSERFVLKNGDERGNFVDTARVNIVSLKPVQE